jgi:Family of unknown function (DUF6491)
MRALLCSLLLPFCGAVLAAAGPSQLDRDAQLILDQPLPESAYIDSVHCLPLRSYRNVEVLDPAHLLFWGSRDRVWLNQLRYPCFGLSDDKILRFETTGSSLCRMDTFQGIDRASQFPSSLCSLQDFERVTPEQANQLRNWLTHPHGKTLPPTPAAKQSDG